METNTHPSFCCNSREALHVTRWMIFSFILQDNDSNQVKTEGMNVTAMHTDPVNGHWLSVETDGTGDTGWRSRLFQRLIEKETDCETLVSSRNSGASEVRNTSYLP